MTAKPAPHLTDVTGPYWEAARKGTLQLQRCLPCRAIVHYPRRWCPHCWSTTLEPIDASGKGAVVSFTIVHQPPDDSFGHDTPYVLAIVQLAEGPTMLANVTGPDAMDVRIGDPVQVRFEMRRIGLVVPQFELRMKRGPTPMLGKPALQIAHVKPPKKARKKRT